jgi:hypothetical protein
MVTAAFFSIFIVWGAGSMLYTAILKYPEY